MAGKIKIGQGGRVNIKWKVLSIDYSHELEENIKAKFAAKYKIPKEHINIEPIFIKKDENGNVSEFTNEMINDIQNPEFQQNLFKPYLNERGIENYDYDKILEIDSLVNSNINYDVYEKTRQYSVKWLKWSNFMSYGEDNFIDLTSFKGIVHVASNPANQGGKSTLCIDLLRFLLFGKVTNRENGWVIEDAFNDFKPEATEFIVEGCICIDGTDYVIRRTVTRPALSKRTEKSRCSQKLQYFKIANSEYIDLVDNEDQEGCTGTETNKIIKESIGNERDFDLMICVSADNLKELISLKDTDRGRLVSRWIGLLPLEEKDAKAREIYNKSISPKLLLNRYNKESLKPEIDFFIEENKKTAEEIKQKKKNKEESEKKLKDFNKTRDTLLTSRLKIDDTLMKIDVTTLDTEINRVIENGKKQREQLSSYTKDLELLGTIEFDENQYDYLIKEDKNISIQLNNTKNEGQRIKNEIETLKKGEFCPTCGAKLVGVDNTEKIEVKTKERQELLIRYKKLENKHIEILQEIENLKEKRNSYNEYNRLSLLKAKTNVDLETSSNRYRELMSLKKNIQDNHDAIAKNNEIELAITNVDINIKTEDNIIKALIDEINDLILKIKTNERTIDEYSKIISQIEEEEKLVYNWKVYLDMIGKNGISKMLIRNVLPIINGKLNHLLTDVCDFRVEVAIDERNDVTFLKIKDGVVSKLSGGSGFEKTASALALRSVLSEISSFSKPSFVVFDEILGCVAAVNYDNLKLLYDKIVANYAFIFHISHIEQIRDWATQTVMVKKEGNISSIEIA